MKKLLSIILMLALFLPAAALADAPDLSGMGFDELVRLREQINAELWTRGEWQEVEVPAGVWEIGKDIPEGHWNISIKQHSCTQIFYCEKVLSIERKPDHSGQSFTTVIAEEGSTYASSASTSVDIDMKAGCYFICEDPVVFTPFTGYSFNFR